MIAVLHDALNCIAKYHCATNTHGRRLFREAQLWFVADDTDWPRGI